MSQFDVHENVGKNADAIPFVVVIQSAAFDDRRSRIVVPLVRTNKVSANVGMRASRLNPTFLVNGVQVTLHALQVVSVPLDALGRKTGSLAHEADAIIDALDEVFSRAYG
ncbi:plasmid maintenance protein CcdB [Rhodocyclus tenuis]|uniref:CcdB family protein n=1 Tax=Rhodocyclus gracilis TaxID=2929842 RepID=UPI001298C4EC|nr:CcdB family protein [Rhodocyclus gracilis]MRD71642.1 plasmid maintenance protein CcdB [Rhodocyclus gracilis]